MVLGKHISEKEFAQLMKDLNRTLRVYWPCTACILFGYFLAPLTFGLSFYMPNLCISDAKSGFIAAIERQNATKLKEKGLLLIYRQGWSMSWLELTVIGPPGGKTGDLEACTYNTVETDSCACVDECKVPLLDK